MTVIQHAKPFDVNTITDDLADKLGIDMSTDKLLKDRGATHGDFGENALISQTLKHVFRDAQGWEQLTYVERETMDMIALKFSRILSGQPHLREHWEDVVGYGKLSLDRCPLVKG